MQGILTYGVAISFSSVFPSHLLALTARYTSQAFGLRDRSQEAGRGGNGAAKGPRGRKSPPPHTSSRHFLPLFFFWRGLGWGERACCVTTKEQRGEDPQLFRSLFNNGERFDDAAAGRPTLLLHFPRSCNSQGFLILFGKQNSGLWILDVLGAHSKDSSSLISP